MAYNNILLNNLTLITDIKYLYLTTDLLKLQNNDNFL